MGGKSITILHLSDLQFGKNHRFAGIELGGLPNPYETLLERLWEDLQGLRKDHKVEPDLVVVTGDLAEWGMPDEFKAVREFLERLTDKDHLNLPRSRVAVVPGNHDVNRKACSAYFENCEADGTQPIPPWQPKWRHFVAMFDELYRGVGPKFTIEEPWTLFEVPDLKVVIAGLNATMVDGHDCQKPGEKPDPKLPHHVGWVGEPQLRWFKTRLAERRAQGWLRIVAVHHNYQRGCKDDDENLEDAADLKRLLGQEINLLLHGHRHEADLAFLNQHVPVFSTGSAALKKEARPEEIPNQYQVLQVFPDQVRRFGRAFFPEGKSFGPDARIGKNDGVAVETVALLDVGATFPGGRTARFDGRGADGRAEIEALRDRGERTDGFLARVAEVCRLQHPKATTTPFPADDRHPAYLRITDPSGGIVCPRPVGVFDHGLTREELERFLSTIDAPYRSADTGLLSEIVCGGERPSEALVQEAWRRRVKVQSFVEFQGLIDFGGYVRKQTERLERDDVYPPKLYVPQRMCFQIGEDKHQADDALGQVQAWLAEPNPRFVIILGDFGTGKTFLLHELARRMGNDDTALVPLFVELRALEKAQSLDTLVAQHLAKSGEERIDIPAFRYMLKQGRIVLFFDGFDELALRVSYDRAAEHFETLVQAADGDAKVVVTSRTQHFESEKQVRTVLYERARPLTGLRYCKLHPFKEDQILQFLRNRWHDAEDPEKEAQDWLALIHNVKDLFGLSETPRMLGFITELKKEDIEKAKKKDSGISSAELYRLLMDRWLIFEYERAHPKGMQVTLSLEARFAAVTAVAMRLWEKTEKFVTTAELSEVTSGAVAQSMTTPPPADIAAHLIGSGSLLRRDDEGCFTFVHQSVMEWLVAREAAQQLKQGAATPGLGTRELSQLMADFFCDLAGRAPAIAWASGVVGRSAAGNDVAKGNALAVLKRLGVKVGLNFAGQILRGKDFGDQWLAHADFSGADLSEARLARKDLTHAKLARARLVAADLTRATLTGADLTEADLSQARLAGADLRGAKLGGAKLRRAVLLGATLDAGALDGLDTLGAALPGDRAPSPVSMGSPSPTTCVAWHPTLDLLATGHNDNSVRIWEPRTGKPLQTLKGHEDFVCSVAFSPDGAALASASFDNTVRIWDPRTGKPLQTLRGHRNHVRCVAFSPDGAALASAGDDNTVRIWDPRTGKPLQTLKGHDGYVRGVAFSPDGAALASGSNDNTVRIWDLRTGACLAVLAGFPEGWVAFTPDGRYKLGGSVAGNFWHMIALCRFEVGELDEFIPGLRLAADEPLFPRLPAANQMAHR